MTRSVPVIADLDISGPFCVFDVCSGHYIFTYLDQAEPGDLPPDIGALPVYGLRSVDSVLYIDTEVNW